MKPRRRIAVIIALILAMSGAVVAVGVTAASADNGAIIVEN
jgi:hypothetical protein